MGVTRARRWLFLTWPAGEGGRTGRSPFIEELASSATTRGAARSPRPPAESSGQRRELSRDESLLQALKRWRLERCRAEGVPAFVVFHDSTLAAISERQPRTLAELRSISGVGPAKIERYGRDVLQTVAGTTRARDADPRR